MTPEMAFAEHIDSVLRSYAESGSFRAALHAELPGAPTGLQGICPPDHMHAATGHCYGNHKCRCEACRAGSSRRQKQARTRRAVAAWAANERKAS